MDTLRELFSHVCGQGRCFASDGQALPVCQRCLGLYLGAAATAAWMAASGIWRRGLPSWPVFIVHVLMLSAALVGGLHLLDAGPSWRALCGLWTGHVLTAWLIGGAWHLRQSRRSKRQPPWQRAQKLQVISAAGLLAILAGALPLLSRRGWWLWTALAGAGAAVLAGALAVGLASLVAWLAGGLWGLFGRRA